MDENTLVTADGQAQGGQEPERQTPDGQVFKERIQRVCNKMRTRGLEQLVISAPTSVFYLTGLMIGPHERMLALLLDSDGTLTLFGNPLFALDTSVLPFSCVLTPDSEDPVAALAAQVRTKSLGIDKDWPARFLLRLMEQCPGLQPCLGSAAVDETRMVKDDAEIKLMRAASRVNDAVMGRTIECLHEGVTESEVAAILSRHYEEMGADLPIGELVVSFGAAAADPHHQPGAAALTVGQCALMDIFTPVAGYWCDMTRTVYLGSVSAQEEEIYGLVRAANAAGIAAVRPGVPLNEVDRAARSVIEDAGFGAFFTHRTGHGCGLDIHEPPDVSASSSAICEPGMIFSIEPGIYIPQSYGVRIEDLVLVTANGCEVLNNYPKDLRIL